MARSLCGTIEKCWVVVAEAVGSHHTHLGPVSEEYVIFKHSDSKRMRRLGSTIEDDFPGKQQQVRTAIKESTTWIRQSCSTGGDLIFNECNLYLSKPL